MTFDVYPIGPNYYEVEYSPSKKRASTILETIVYIPQSTQYAITPEAFSKRLYTKRFSELTRREAWELMGLDDKDGKVTDISRLGHLPTLTLSGFFYKFPENTINPTDTPSDTDPVISLCQKYLVPYIKVRFLQPGTLKHVTTLQEHIPGNWHLLGTLADLQKLPGYDIDNDEDFIFHTDFNYKDPSSTYIYEEEVEKEVPCILVPVIDNKQTQKVLKELGISINLTNI